MILSGFITSHHSDDINLIHPNINILINAASKSLECSFYFGSVQQSYQRMHRGRQQGMNLSQRQQSEWVEPAPILTGSVVQTKVFWLVPQVSEAKICAHTTETVQLHSTRANLLCDLGEERPFNSTTKRVPNHFHRIAYLQRYKSVESNFSKSL